MTSRQKDGRPPVMYISRSVKFSAAHRLHSHKLSDEENKNVFAKCNHINGHGHNYKVEVVLRGPVDEKTGMVFNLSDLNRIMQTAVMEPCDHKNLDLDVLFFKDRPSTTENLSLFVWMRIKEMLSCTQQSHLLHQVTIHETDNNTVVYRGE